MCARRATVTMNLSLLGEDHMEATKENVWGALSRQIAETIEAVQESIVTVHGGGRSTSSGVVWRPGVVVTVRHGLRRGDSLQVAHHGDPFPAPLAGADAGTAPE